jgi:hypothetical protein
MKIIMKLINQEDQKMEIFREEDDLCGVATPAVTLPISDVYPLGHVNADSVMKWEFPVNAVSGLLSTQNNIEINRDIGSDKYGLVQFHTEDQLYDAPFIRSEWASNLALYRFVIGDLEMFTNDRLKDNLDSERDTLVDCKVQVSSGIKDCDTLLKEIKDSKGQGTNLRPDNDKRRKQAQSDVELLKSALEQTLSLIKSYNGSINDLGEVSDKYLRWSNSINAIPFNVVSNDLFKTNLKNLIKEDFSSGETNILLGTGIALEVSAYIAISIGVLPAIWVSFGMPLAALGGLATGLGPVGWVIAGLLAVVGGILILVSEIKKANAYKDWYEDISKETTENTKNIQTANSELSDQIELISKVFSDIDEALKSADPSLQIESRSDTMQALTVAAIESDNYMQIRNLMWERMEEGDPLDYAAKEAVRSIISEKDARPAYQEVMITGYYIGEEDYEALKQHYQKSGLTDDEIKTTMATALLVNSNSPQEVVEKLKELEIYIEIERVINIRNDNHALMQFSKNCEAA